jgi:hypothetical protein
MNENVNKISAIKDLLLLGTVFWGIWSLRFFGVGFIGALTMGAGIVMCRQFGSVQVMHHRD